MLQRAGGFGVRVFFLGVLGLVTAMGDYTMMSMKRHDALDKAGMRKWHALCLLLGRSMTKLILWPFDDQALKSPCFHHNS